MGWSDIKFIKNDQEFEFIKKSNFTSYISIIYLLLKITH